MKTSFETPRLLLRELLPSDDIGMFELDSNPEVHRFLGNSPVTSIEQSCEAIGKVRVSMSKTVSADGRLS